VSRRRHRGTAAGTHRGRTRGIRVAGVLLLLTIGVAVIGPWLAPHLPTRIVGPPYAGPGSVPGAPLGTDYLGRDVLSRVLDGGRAVILTGVFATALSCLAGGVVGLTVALLAPRRPRAANLLMRLMDALAALPPLLMVLLVLAAAPGRLSIVLAVTVAGLPLTARTLRAAAASVVQRGHVEVAIARGEALSWLLGREILPFVSGQLLADAGTRFVQSIYVAVAAGFLGLAGGATDWGSLISEALPGAQLQPWALVVPATLVAVLAVTANLVADELAHRSRRILA